VIPPPPPPVGVYHIMEKGQTLWRISKVYGVSVETLMKINKITDPSRIKVGTPIFIPGARVKKDVPSTVQVEKEETFSWPVKGRVISYFGVGEGKNPRGIDIKTSEGTKVKASRSGTVVYARPLRGYGKVVILDHGDGYSTVYAYNSLLLVKEGDRVKKGEPIAIVSQFQGKSYAMCHFEIRKGNEAEDPLSYLP